MVNQMIDGIQVQSSHDQSKGQQAYYLGWCYVLHGNKRFLKFLESQRTTRTKDSGATVEGSHQLKALYGAVAEEGQTVVRAEAKDDSTSTPMDCSSME